MKAAHLIDALAATAGFGMMPHAPDRYRSDTPSMPARPYVFMRPTKNRAREMARRVRQMARGIKLA